MTDQIIQEVKARPIWFHNYQNGTKRFSIRFNDRNYQEGTYLLVREWEEKTGYSGNFCFYRIIGVFDGMPGLESGYVILSLQPIILDGCKE